jgi:hypothetical protein
VAKSVTSEHKAIANHVRNAFGGSCEVTEYSHDHLLIRVDILQCPNRPDPGVTSYSTIGLSDTPMMYEGEEYPVRLEMVGASYTREDDVFARILSTAAFSVMRTHWLVAPGTVLPNVVREYLPSSQVPHLYFTAPFIWEDKLTTLDLPKKPVAFLFAMPISEAEYQYRLEYGDEAFEKVLEKSNIDIYDLERPSTIRNVTGKRKKKP